MIFLDAFHEQFLKHRRARVLSEHIAALIPRNATVLDVGSGDGEIALRVGTLRQDLTVQGIDVLVRPATAVPVKPFDGACFPFDDATFDTVVFVDVLHHTADPTVLLEEAARVARTSVVVKDHVLHGAGAHTILRFMDLVGNGRHGVALPYNYLTYEEWEETFDAAGLAVQSWDSNLGIYAWPASMVFDRKLHFTASLAA